MVGGESFSSGEHTELRTRRNGVSRRNIAIVALALVAMVSAWILGTAQSAGPDEPGHSVRAAALVRGQLDGREPESGINQREFDLPAHIGFPPPDCFAFRPYTPAQCATDLEVPTGQMAIGTRAADYPVWGHLPAGVGTLGPAAVTPWTARAADAAIPLLLLLSSVVVAARRGVLGVGATLLAMTPMAWFMFATVNPNGLTIAGGLAVWTGLSALEPGGGRTWSPPDGAAPWLVALGWAALVLPRRDGLVWGALILAIALLVLPIGGRALGHRIGKWPLAVIGGTTLVTLAWAAGSDTNDARALFLTPLAPVSAIVARRLWSKCEGYSIAIRWAGCVLGVIVGLVALGVVMATRPNGFDRGVLRLVIGATGENFRQAIGVLSWLDTPVPTSAMFLCVLAVGALVGAALIGGDSIIWMGMTAIVIVCVLVSWTLTMLQGDDSGLYWQGRYYLPLLVGVPVLGARLTIDADQARRLGIGVLAIGLVVTNLGLAAMMRRFSGGIGGTLLPWEWDNYGAPVPPVALLVVHVAASGVILRWAASLVDKPEVAESDGGRAGDGDSVLDA